MKGAEYNPRHIDDHARKKLQENLKKKGLLSPLVWNKRTGNLVSGHQRLSIIDDLQGSDNYQIDLAVVDLDEKTEREQNIFFNNQSAMGTWDVDALGNMFAKGEVEIDYKTAGFDDMDLQVIFDGSPYAKTMFSLDDAPQAVKDNVASLEEIQAMKRARKEFKNEDIEANDSEFYAVVVFPNRQTQSRFMERVGLDKNERYVDGVRLYSALEAAKPSTKGEFTEAKFWLPKDAEQVVESEIVRISSLLNGKNIRGRALEYMAVNSAQTPLDNLTGESAAEISSEDPPEKKKLSKAERKERKRRKKEKLRKKREQEEAA